MGSSWYRSRRHDRDTRANKVTVLKRAKALCPDEHLTQNAVRASTANSSSLVRRVQYQGAGGPTGHCAESADSSAIAVYAHSSSQQEVCCPQKSGFAKPYAAITCHAIEMTNRMEAQTGDNALEHLSLSLEQVCMSAHCILC